MAPKRAAGAEDGTTVRKKRKTKLASAKPRARKVTNVAPDTENEDDGVPPPKKRKTTHGASNGLQLATDEDTTTDHSTNSIVTPAGDAVLATSELLDAIISFLPFGDILFNAQRVCKDWKNTITKSPTIQTKLWLKSQASKPLSPHLFSAKHPLLTGTLTEESYYYRTDLLSNLPLYNGKVAYNPLVSSGRLKLLAPSPHRRSSYGIYNLAGFPVKNSFNIHELQCVNKAQHSWLDMFLTEPPVTTAQLNISVPVRTDSDNSYHVVNESLHDPCGLTFRTIMDRAEQIFQSDEWRTTRRYRFCKPGLARVRVELFAGEEF